MLSTYFSTLHSTVKQTCLCTSHEGVYGKWTYNSNQSYLDTRGEWSAPCPGRLPPFPHRKKNHRSSLKRRLGVSHNRSKLREQRVLGPPSLRVKRNKFWHNWQIFVKPSLNLITLDANHSLYFKNPTTNFNETSHSLFTEEILITYFLHRLMVESFWTIN
jgi:hypothetical protein